MKIEFAENQTGRVAQRMMSPIFRFMEIQASGGVLLLATTALALLCANLLSPDWYFGFINTPVNIQIGGFVLEKTFLLLVNDGLMAIFFYLVGLEIKREIKVGELSTPKKASFSIFGALGGMLFPALIFVFFNRDSGYINGWGVPMATDIAFAVGVLTLLGSRVPTPLKVFLLALAIVDDLGAILVIALFYTHEIASSYLGVAGLALFVLFLLNHSGMRNIAWGIAFGSVVWFCFLKSGVHATVAGVLLAFVTPSYAVNAHRERTKELLLDKYIHALHPWVAFGIMPIFAFFNAGVAFGDNSFAEMIQHPVVLGVSVGLVLGNPLGIFTLTFIATKTKIAEFPRGVTWFQILGVGCLAGIGFTMSLFIGSLAFGNMPVEDFSKIGVLLGSGVAMVLGFAALIPSLRSKN